MNNLLGYISQQASRRHKNDRKHSVAVHGATLQATLAESLGAFGSTGLRNLLSTHSKCAQCIYYRSEISFIDQAQPTGFHWLASILRRARTHGENCYLKDIGLFSIRTSVSKPTLPCIRTQDCIPLEEFLLWDIIFSSSRAYSHFSHVNYPLMNEMLFFRMPSNM